MRETCCWNTRHNLAFHNEDCETLGPKWGSATMVVTFVDGVVVEYPNVRFSINRIATDPTKVNGTTVTIEDDEQEITLCGVRSFKMEHGL